MNSRPSSRKGWEIIIAATVLAFAGCEKTRTLESEINKLKGQIATSRGNIDAAKETLWLSQAELESLNDQEMLLEAPGNQPHAETGEIGVDLDADAQKLALSELSNVWDARRQAMARQSLVDGFDDLKTSSSGLLKQTRPVVVDQYPVRLHDAQVLHRVFLEDAKRQQSEPWLSVPRALLSSDFFPLWVALLPALLLVWAIIRHDFRHRVRTERRTIVNATWLGLTSYPLAMLKLLWVNKLLLVTALSLFVIVLSIQSLRPSKQELLTRHRDKLQKLNKDLAKQRNDIDQKTADASREVDALRDENSKRFTVYHQGLVNELVGAPGDDNAGATQEQIRELLATAHDSAIQQVGKFATSVGFANKAGGELSAHASKAADQDEKLSTFENTSRSHRRTLVFTKGALVALFLGLNAGLVVTWRKQRKKLDRAISEVCPRCLGENTIKSTPTQGIDEGAQNRTLLQCENHSCQYQIDARHKNLLRLRVPTVGYVESGKTVWLTMFHRYVEQGRADKALAKFDRAPSPGTEDAIYDEILRGLVEQRAPSLPTTGERSRLREPLLFNFADGDPTFVTNGILNLFDLAGEVSSPEFRGSESQDRALRLTDGFLYFLDPTRTDDKYLNQQRRQLASFCEELRKKRGVSYGKPLQVPIAVCISKLDMLAKPDEAGAGVYQEFVNELGPASRELEPSLKEIRRRHKLFTTYRNQFFPGWEIEEQIVKLVGGRFMFFPMSAAGFTGVTGHDPKDWNFKPFGIVEPLVWLLHMNGFKTL